MLLLVTGATGKVGQALIASLQADPRFDAWSIRALCHHRELPVSSRLSVVRGSIADRETCRLAMDGVTHVVHLATCKETPEDVMDVTVKGLFWLLEEFRLSQAAQRFVLIGGDAGIGHMFHEHEQPVTEGAPHKAYPGCYALSKVLEEVMLQQFGIQYGIDWCCLRAPWIMEKDDFRYVLSFGDDQFGGPLWAGLIGETERAICIHEGAVPLLQDGAGKPLKRNFVHVDDLIEAIKVALTSPAARQRLFNICMDEPVDYGQLASYMARTRNLPAREISGEFYSNHLDNSRARAELGWRPAYDLERLIESAWSYQRPPEEPRRVWYPG
jgi:nucleoside-diphosphate-sugar epimerase